MAEFVEFQDEWPSRVGDLLSKERHSKIPDIPTAIEQGFNVSSTNMHFWWAPKGTPQDRVEEACGCPTQQRCSCQK